LISSGNKQVLIDGLHREYKPDYAFSPPALRRALESGLTPYNEIDVVLVSHIHLDHFHAEAVGLHLKNNPAAVLVSSDQVVDAVKKDFQTFAGIELRIRRIEHKWKQQTMLEVAGVKIRTLGLRHSGANFSWIQNLGHLIEIGGKKFLHIGDADMTDENFASFSLAQEGIDVAFIPYWYLLSESGRALVNNQFRPRHIIAVHIPPAEAESVAAKIASSNPDATSFTKILQTKRF
jgi:L-ascorbate metabolism protein UlaG (beta-lactamase superfamily)